MYASQNRTNLLITIMKLSHPLVRQGVMFASMLAVVVGAWTIYRSLAKTPIETFPVEERVISKTIEVPATVLEKSEPITITAAHDGIVSVVSALPGSPVGAGDVLVEFDRHIQEAKVVQALRVLLRVQKPSDETLNSRDLSDRIKQKEGTLARLSSEAEAAVTALRSRSVEYADVLLTVRATIADLEKKLATATAPEESADSPKELEEAVTLLRIAVEGNSLSESLALSDIRTFFGADGTTTAFLKTIPEPQEAVPYWEKLLEAERLQRIVSEKIKNPPSVDAQTELQLLLTSKAVAEQALDIINGLRGLNDKITPTNDYPLSEQQASARLLERNLASIQAAWESFKIHERRFLGVLEKQGTQEAQVNEKEQELRSQLQAALADRSKKITMGNEDIRKAQLVLNTARQKQSEVLQEVERLKAQYEYATGTGEVTSSPSISSLERDLVRERSALEDHTVHALTSGVIEEVLVRVGDALHAGDPLVRVRPIALSIEAQVSDKQVLRHVTNGHIVEIILDREGGRQILSGVIESVDYQRSLVRIIPVSFQTITPGATLTVRITATTDTPVLAIQRWLVVPNDNHPLVSVVGEDNSVTTQEIGVGLIGDDDWVEVETGLQKGQKITTPVLASP